MKVSQIAKQLGLCRRRIDKWIQLDELPERNRMQPRPGMPEAFSGENLFVGMKQSYALQ